MLVGKTFCKAVTAMRETMPDADASIQIDPADQHVDQWPDHILGAIHGDVATRSQITEDGGIVSCVAPEHNGPSELYDIE